MISWCLAYLYSVQNVPQFVMYYTLQNMTIVTIFSQKKIVVVLSNCYVITIYKFKYVYIH